MSDKTPDCVLVNLDSDSELCYIVGYVALCYSQLWEFDSAQFPADLGSFLLWIVIFAILGNIPFQEESIP